MTNPKKINRRDAIKLLGAAAGAAALANLPAKWSKPELISGVLPAHAQTSCSDYAVFIEILTGDEFSFTVLSSPAPDLQAWDGTPGSTLGWSCQSACLFLYLDFHQGASGSVRITTIAGQFIENYGPAVEFRDIVIEMGTGAYSNVSGGSAGSCSWDEEPQDLSVGRSNRSNSWGK